MFDLKNDPDEVKNLASSPEYQGTLQRLRKAEEEEPVGAALADYVVVNDDLETTIHEMLEIINRERQTRQK